MKKKESLLEHHSSKASVLQRSAFFIVQLSVPYMITGKKIALTRWTFLDKVMSLLFNMLSRLVITFLPRSKHLLISWLQSPSAVILEPRKIKSAISTVFPSFAMKWWDRTHGHHQMVNTEIRLILLFAAKDGEALYSQQKQDWELTVAQIMNSLLPNTDLNWRK